MVVNPTFKEAWYALGIAYKSIGLEFKPDFQDTWFSLGNTLYKNGDIEGAIDAYKKAGAVGKRLWEFEGQKKVVLKVENEKELLEVFKNAKREKLPAVLIRDAGRTQILCGSATAVGIGPAKDEKIDQVVGNLKLY